MADQLAPLVARLEAVTSRLEGVAPGGGGARTPAEELVPFVVAYDEFLAGPLAEYVAEAKKLGGDAATHADLVKKAFSAQRDFVLLASKCKKPDDMGVAKLLKPQADVITQITQFRESNRRSPQYNHLSTISESIAALSWVVTAPAPAPFIKEMNDAGLFWGNRVIKENKAHQAFTRAWSEALKALQAYVKQHHTTGLSWNMRGADAASVAGGDAATKGPGGPAPPPPPPPPKPAPVSAGPDPTEQQRAALFNDINRGSAITQGLRHVTKDMQTHKNTGLRASSTVPGSKPAIGPKPGAGRPAAPVKRAPVCELQGKKWVIEHQDNNLELQLNETQMNQTVYAFNCVDSVITVKGKVNSIIFDSCKKSAIIFDSVVASVEFVNCISCQVQVNEKVPTISIDKTDGLQMYLSKESLDVVLVTSKSSEMNVLVPKGDGDYTELPVAEQFKTTLQGNKLVTVVNEST
ncbi:adenylyl cyclase-associated protein 1-like isoform X2 [Amphibalanus amphitrite]|nr:adenylyl cyclase-associated protein 1-like isoform X2 [Amphibalanus amphitrite]XP_043215118.1 adenylyl cyclase-associated protein 1-like isoform X2 [Amphibalanus amphitrite]XP_043215119.1 adenylyl cyclase-associated protein 1-like isoform X2 [Amphibalanus amphitrite]XP_043215120.1 adenylyl cyclase-associated protein 1-like isoform X2 [Amphibalanus amphitrite]XP_043215122.1 adenylyl cyclase-associated protein 1-like isoform X2 [Amphibalanus amphitrite]XP_043215123.1 adenylyl cyclase-associat